jgi:hypothetical protein
MPGAAFAATVDIASTTASAGAAKVALSVQMQAGPDENVVGLQFDIRFDPQAVEFAGAETGPAARSVGKEANYSQPEEGTARVIVAGFNTNAIASGEIVVLRFDVKSNAPSGSSDILLEDLIVSDQRGRSVPSTPGHGAIIVEGGVAPAPPSSDFGCAAAKDGNAFACGNGSGDIIVLAGVCFLFVLLPMRRRRKQPPS